jgi:hypothetical protein
MDGTDKHHFIEVSQAQKVKSSNISGRGSYPKGRNRESEGNLKLESV